VRTRRIDAAERRRAAAGERLWKARRFPRDANGPQAASLPGVTGSAHRKWRSERRGRAPGTMPVSLRAGWLLIFARRRACRWKPARGLAFRRGRAA